MSSRCRFIAPVAASYFAMLAPSIAHAADCQSSADCPKGFDCIELSSGCATAEPCDAKTGVCPPAPDCASKVTRQCQPLPCTQDADCAAGMVCHQYSSTGCSGVATPCPAGQDCAPPPPPDCTTVTNSECVPRWELECSADADCGAGFTCVGEQTCTCGSAASGGAGGASSVEPAPAVTLTRSSDMVPASVPVAAPISTGRVVAAPAPSSGEVAAPACTCVSSGVGRCQAVDQTCSQDSECPQDWSCVEQANDGVCGSGGTSSRSPTGAGAATAASRAVEATGSGGTKGVASSTVGAGAAPAAAILLPPADGAAPAVLPATADKGQPVADGAGATNASGIANPASVNCVDKGGTLDIREGTGGQYGVCKFKDGSECDEWAYYRGECKPGECVAWESCKLTADPRPATGGAANSGAVETAPAPTPVVDPSCPAPSPPVFKCVPPYAALGYGYSSSNDVTLTLGGDSADHAASSSGVSEIAPTGAPTAPGAILAAPAAKGSAVGQVAASDNGAMGRSSVGSGTPAPATQAPGELAQPTQAWDEPKHATQVTAEPAPATQVAAKPTEPSSSQADAGASIAAKNAPHNGTAYDDASRGGCSVASGRTTSRGLWIGVLGLVGLIARRRRMT